MAARNATVFNRKLRDEFIGWVLLLSVLITSFYGFYAYNRSKGQLDAELGQRLVSVAKLTAAQLDPERMDLLREYGVDYEGQRRQLVRLRNIADVRNIYVLDRESRVIVDARGDFQVGERNLMLSLDEAEQERAWQGRIGISTLYQGSDQEYYKSAYVPLFRGESEVAYLVGVEASAAFLQAVADFGRGMMMAAVLFIAAALVIGLVLARYILRPIERLARGAEKIGEGRFSVAIPEEPRNEIGFLARAFNDMTRQLKAHNDYMLESLTSGLIAVDSEGQITTVNQAAADILGRAARRMIGRNYRLALKDQLRLVTLMERALQGKVLRNSEVYLPEREMHLLAGSVSLKNKSGRVVGAEVLLVDNTELKRLQTEVVLKERLAALGEMSAGVAHEIRNPLGAIQGFVELLQRKGVGSKESVRYLGEVRREIGVLNRVVSDFLDFARPSKLALTPCMLEPLIEEVLALAEAEAKQGKVTVKTRIAPDLPLVNLDVEKFRRAVLNVVLNSLQAAHAGGGKVEVRCRKRAAVARGKAVRGKVILEIKDNGPGISADVLAKIFHPFFTTKDKGTGLGLAIVHKIIEEHGGNIRVESKPRAGTTFYIELSAEE